MRNFRSVEVVKGFNIFSAKNKSTHVAFHLLILTFAKALLAKLEIGISH